MRYFMPDMSAGNAEKDSPSFGLQMARMIDGEWGSERMTKMRNKIRLMRSHMEGEVDASHLKALFNKPKDLSAMRVNWKYSSEVPKFINSVVEGFSYDKYRTTVKGVDMHSQEARSKFRREKLKAMYVKQTAEELSRRMGMDFTAQGFVPESKEELNMYMDLEYKPATELATEIAIQKSFDFSDWRETFNHIAEDLASNGIGVARVVPDPNTIVRFEYNDPENFIYGRDVDGTRDGSKRGYYGQYIPMTVSQVERLAHDELGPKQLQGLARLSGFNGGYGNMSQADKQNSVDVMYFTFSANRYDMVKKKFYKNGGYKYIAKEDYWNPPLEMKSEGLAIPYEVWYEGYYVPGADVVFGYKLVDDMMRDPSNKRKAIPPFMMFKLSSEPIGHKLIDISDDIYVAKIKIRQFVLKMKPKGYAIDIDGLGFLDVGEGAKLSVLDTVKIMMEDGNLLYSGSSLVDDSTGARAFPVHDMPDGDGRELGELMNVYNLLVRQLSDITGINPQAVGGAPPPRTSEAVYQGTISSSQRVVNNIFNGLMSIQKRAAEAIMARLHSAAVFGETESIVRSIMGEYTTDIIKEVANIKNYQYMVNIDIRSTDAERAAFIQSLSEALQTGSISILDKIDIEEIENLRLAKQVIKLRQKANQEKAAKDEALAHQRKMEELQIQGQQEMQKTQFEQEMDMQMKTFEAELKAKLEAFTQQGKLREISLEGQWRIAVEKERAKAQRGTESYKEDRKDKRIGMQSSNQSALIEQRNQGTPAKQFEERSTEKDVMEGVNPFGDLSPNI